VSLTSNAKSATVHLFHTARYRRIKTEFLEAG
jgi:hypothetical protein